MTHEPWALVVMEYYPGRGRAIRLLRDQRGLPRLYDTHATARIAGRELERPPYIIYRPTRVTSSIYQRLTRQPKLSERQS